MQVLNRNCSFSTTAHRHSRRGTAGSDIEPRLSIPVKYEVVPPPPADLEIEAPLPSPPLGNLNSEAANSGEASCASQRADGGPASSGDKVGREESKQPTPSQEPYSQALEHEITVLRAREVANMRDLLRVQSLLHERNAVELRLKRELDEERHRNQTLTSELQKMHLALEHASNKNQKD